MKLKSLRQDDGAVSPVIGVILMVAITVILAAVIAAFVLGLGPGDNAPTAKFSFDYDESTNDVTITHESGDSIPYDQISVTGTALSSSSDWPSSSATGSSDGESAIVSGDTYTVTASSTGTVRVVWTSEDGGTTSTLGETNVNV